MAIADSITAEVSPLHQETDGTIRVGHTRISLDLVICSYLDGMTPEQIAASFETLDLGDVYAAIAYFHHHRADVEEYLRVRSDRAEAINELWEARSSSAGLRDRLQARLKSASKAV